MGFASENESVDLSKSYYKRAIEMNLSAKSALSWARLGRLYLQENSLDSGAVYLKKAIRLSPALEEARVDQVRLRLF